jgi:adenosylcobinamide-GDP ribazoletransferase
VLALNNPLRLFLRRCLAATQSFTRIPVTGSLAQWADLQPDLAASSARHFPGVGLVVGMAACVVFALISLPLPQGPLTPLAAAVAATIATVLLTGALHEESALRHTGVVRLVLLLAAKLSLLAVLGYHSPAGVMAALLAGHAVSRFWPVLLACSLPHALHEIDALGAPLAQAIDMRGLAVAGTWCIVPLALMAAAGGVRFLLLAVLASGVAYVMLRARLRARLRGFTLDSLGFAQQVTETCFYLGAAFGVSR